MTRPHDHGDADHCNYCLAVEEAGREAGQTGDYLQGMRVVTGASGDDPWAEYVPPSATHYSESVRLAESVPDAERLALAR